MMKYWIVILVLLGAACSSTPNNTAALVGSGTPKTEVRPVGAFESISIGGSGELVLLRGDTFRLEIEADDNLLPYIASTVETGTLRLGLDGRTSIATRSRLVYRVTLPTLKHLTLAGSVSVTSAAFDYATLTLTLGGSTQATLTGSAEQVVAVLEGSAQLDASQLAAALVDIRANGSSQARVQADETLKAVANGSGVIRYRGAASLTQETNGSGQIIPDA